MSWDGDPHFKECHDEVKVSTCLETPSQVVLGVRRGALVPSEGNTATGSQKAKQRDITRDYFRLNPFPAEKLFAHLWGKWGLVLRLRLPRLDPQKEDQHWLLWKYSEDTAERSREMLGPSQTGKKIVAAKTLTHMLAYCRLPTSWVLIHGTSPGCELLLQMYISQTWHEYQRQTTHNYSLLSQRDSWHAWQRWRTGGHRGLNLQWHSCHQAVESHGCYPYSPGRLCSWVLPRDQGQHPLGESARLSSDCDNFPQVQTTAGTPSHSQTMSAIHPLFPQPNWASEAAMFVLFCLTRNRHQRAASTEAGP